MSTISELLDRAPETERTELLNAACNAAAKQIDVTDMVFVLRYKVKGLSQQGALRLLAALGVCISEQDGREHDVRMAPSSPAA